MLSAFYQVQRMSGSIVATQADYDNGVNTAEAPVRYALYIIQDTETDLGIGYFMLGIFDSEAEANSHANMNPLDPNKNYFPSYGSSYLPIS